MPKPTPAMVEVTAILPAFTIGLDLGDRKSEFAVISAAGNPLANHKVATTKSALADAFRAWPGARIVLEASTHSPWISELLRNRGFDVFVANPRSLPLPSGRDKSDKLDAFFLARVGRLDVTLLQEVCHRPLDLRLTMTIVRSRKALVEARTQLINSVRGQLKSLDGIRPAKCSSNAFPEAVRDVLPQSVGTFDPILQSIEELTDRIKQLDRSIDKAVKDFPELVRLTQVAGVGPLTALTFMLVIHDVNRFKKSRSVGAYCGLVPRRAQSGDVDPQLSISKRGDPYLRQLLVSAAHYILGPLNKTDSDLRRFGLEMIGDGTNRARKKRAVVAVARRLAVLLHALWRNGEQYEPLRNASRRQNSAA